MDPHWWAILAQTDSGSAAPPSGGGMPGAEQLVQILQYAGALAALVIFVLGLRLKWWYMADSVSDIRADRDRLEQERRKMQSELEDTRQQRDEWRLLAREATITTRRSTRTALAIMTSRAMGQEHPRMPDDDGDREESDVA